MSSEPIPARITRLTTEIQDLEQAIEAIQNQPIEAIEEEEGEYPAIAAVRRLLDEADTKEQSGQRLDMLTHNLEEMRTEVERLKALAHTKEQTIESLQREQAKAFAKYQKLESQLLAQAKVLIGFGQAIAEAEESMVSFCRPGVLYSVRSVELKRWLSLEIEGGRVKLGLKDHELIQFSPEVFGGFSAYVPDCKPLIQEAKSA